MACMTAIRVYLQFISMPYHNDIGLNILLIVNFCGLLAACVIIGFVCNVYFIVYTYYIRPRQMEEDEEFVADREQKKIF